MDTLDELTENIPEGIKPIIHSDQGWHYQLNYYTDKLSEKKFMQSMSRKGNCLDNAPIESFFHLLKTECLNGFPQCKDIGEFKEITKNYVDWFNNRRILQKTKGMTPCEYREHALAV
ncbi:IS3 family transposase [Lactiplantibacillus plantarum]|uniref:IS3 family transposase n=1 Tax=Lactiplantibacillus plantarum TaxID=1590 RepID=UPI000AEA896E|nr:IS3 family transposase [Lactiplantibacillus plantarum]MCG0675370.1 transposase [Lactiplantibacillus plantarum]MCG0783260.1 transposase [Lactiplantibacillus plantarum]MCG0810783.1 transposase [Lactiplantibacillus plantarum]MCG0863868.1 transposase [Lactiplantibacillus plantarum]